MSTTTVHEQMLSPYERNYLKKNWKRKDRSRMRKFVRVLTTCSPLNTEPLRLQIVRSHLPDDYKRRLFEMITGDCCEKNVALVTNALRIPFQSFANAHSVDETPMDTLRRAEALMEQHITGHVHAKREVLTTLAQWKAGGTMPFAIALEGAAGIGKTTFVKHALGLALGRPLATICLGGASDASYLLGHGFTYEGARHGRLVDALMETGVADPILYFDELDKISDTNRGDELVNVLIHLTDPAQNSSIRDRYFQGLDLDFGRCVIVFSYK